MAGKWNYETHEYDAYTLPKGAALYSSDMDKIINCASCGRTVVFGDTFTSFEIHDAVGFGYGVCPLCHAQEVKRALEAKDGEESEDKPKGNDVMEKDIRELDLSVRVYHCLKRVGIDTIEDVCNRGCDRIKCIRGMGRKAFDELSDKMRELGVWFKEE